MKTPLVFLFILLVIRLSAGAVVYHVDCENGNDDRGGTSPSLAWRSMQKANGADLVPGDQLLFRRGCSWNGPLDVNWDGTEEQPIVIGAYGTGDMPVIRDGESDNVAIRGTWMMVESLSVVSGSASEDPGCRDQPVGWKIGFRFASGAAHNTLQYVKSSGHATGVFLQTGSHHNRVFHSDIVDNVVMTRNTPGGDDDSGAFGVLINGSDNEIAWNYLENNLAWCSYDYGIDGSSVEIYNGQRNSIHHNLSFAEGTFTELGGADTDDNTFAFNLVVSDVAQCIFLNVRGPGTNWGPNWNTRAYNNTVYLTGEESQGLVCGGDCSPDVLVFKNNIIWIGWKAVWVDYGDPDESHNIWWRSDGNPLIQNLNVDATSQIIDPDFFNPEEDLFFPAAGSPARDAGTSAVIDAGFTEDLNENSLPQENEVDIGAFEFMQNLGVTRHRPATKKGARAPLLWIQERIDVLELYGLGDAQLFTVRGSRAGKTGRHHMIVLLPGRE